MDDQQKTLFPRSIGLSMDDLREGTYFERAYRRDRAAGVVGTAIRMARLARHHQLPMAQWVMRRLVEMVDQGDPTAILVWKWLAARGQLNSDQQHRPKLRLVAGEGA
ncbi:hypothetical protein [Nitratireductor basaltis]|uniref:Uncharacterized protein n=1 Tax=Nitratireductor basaltis TaxID=472175 RepID=A0A084U9F6_9HYPH|nr:hypothetical protein [Nitratireductor basaltis]KFB09592.1 hypothetical protein EL18_00608 [Nitratireductor basaltis]